MVGLPRRRTPGMVAGWMLVETGAADARKHSSNSRNADGGGEGIMIMTMERGCRNILPRLKENYPPETPSSWGEKRSTSLTL